MGYIHQKLLLEKKLDFSITLYCLRYQKLKESIIFGIGYDKLSHTFTIKINQKL